MDYVIDMGNPIISLHYDPVFETIIIACQQGSKDKKLTHWNIPQLKKVNVLDDGDYSNELAVISWSKEQQGSTSNIERAKLSGINIDTTKYNNNELYGLENSIVVSSDNNGMIYIWNFDNKKKTQDDNEYSSQNFIKKDDNGANILTPLRMFNIHEGPPTSILIDAFKIVTAGSDGKINIIDSLNSTLIRTFYCRKSKNNPKNTNVMRRYNIINGIEMDKYQICVNFGNSIKIWDFDTERVKESKKKNKTSREILSLKLARNKNIMEDYKTSCELLEKEKKQEKVNSKNSKRFNGSINEVLTEEELMAYAMMLSMDQKEQVISSTSNNNDNEINDDIKYDPSQFESNQEEIPDNYTDEQEKRDFLYASELAKQDMYMEKINDEINNPNDQFDDNYYEYDDEDNGVSAEQYFKEEKIKQEQRKKNLVNSLNKANDELVNNICDTPTSSNTIIKEKCTQNGELSNIKGGKKGKNKKNKGKKKGNFIPIDEWEGNNNHDIISINNTSHNNNFKNNKDPIEMDEEEYLNYVLQLSLHDK